MGVQRQTGGSEPRPSKLVQRSLLVLSIALYAVHSFAGLALEVTWIKSLTGLLGMSVPAISVVLATFLAGLGFGSFLLPSLLKHRPPFLLLGVIQAGIGSLAIGAPFVFGQIDVWYSAYAPALDTIPHLGLRSVIAGILLLPLTTLIGTGFPLLAAISTSAGAEHSAQRPGVLYFVGLGASAVGTLVALQAIPVFGLSQTSAWIGVIHLLVALVALVCHVRIGPIPRPLTSAQTPDQPRQATPYSSPDPNRWGAACVIGLAATMGMAMIALELVGTAYLWLIVNNTVYAEGAVLAAVLVAMAAGAGLYRALRRWTSAFSLIILALLLGVIGQLALPVFAGDLAWAFDQWRLDGTGAQSWVAGSAARFSLLTGSLAVVALGLPALAYSLAFSCLCELRVRQRVGPGFVDALSMAKSLADVYAWHNWAGAAGAVLVPVVLLPVLGLTKSFLLITLFPLLGLCLVLLFAAPRSWRSARWAGPALSLVGLFLFSWQWSHADLSFHRAATGEGQTVLFHVDDGIGLVEVLEDPASGGRTLLTNRLRQEGGSRSEDLRIQRIQGYLPILLHPHPKHILAVGLGTGITLSATLRSEVEQVTLVEISEGVIDAATRYFGEANGHILRHPKVGLVHQDGRNFVKLTRERYDVIVQELFFPYQSGVGSLYTREHYERCRDRLAPGGLVVQWITSNQLETDDLRTLVRTFLTVFPHTTLWLNGGYLALVGTLQPQTLDLQDFLARYAATDPLGGPASLIPDPFDFLSLFLSDDRTLHGWSAPAPLNTDDNLYLEFHIPLAISSLNSIELAGRTLESLLLLHRPLADFVRTESPAQQAKLAQVSEGSRLLVEGIVARAHGREAVARTKYAEAFTLNPANYQARSFLARDLAAQGRALLIRGDDREAADRLDQALALNPTDPDVRFDLAVLHAREGHDLEAVRLYRQLLIDHTRWPHRPTAEFNLGVSLYRLRRFEEARQAFDSVLRSTPASIDAHFNLANSLANLGASAEAAGHYRQVLQLDHGHQEARTNLDLVMNRLNTDVPSR